MASLNKVMIIGNLGRDPEIRYTPKGEAVATLSVATTDTWKDKDTGDKREQTEWHRISFFGPHRRSVCAIPEKRLSRVCGRQPTHPQIHRQRRRRKIHNRNPR